MSLLNNNITEDIQSVIYDITAKLGVSPHRVVDFYDGVQVNWKVKENISAMWRSNGMEYVELYGMDFGMFYVDICDLSTSDLLKGL